MQIDTLQDWNQVIGGCCCQMPMATPMIDEFGVLGFVWMYRGFVNPSDGKRYLTKRTDYADGGFHQESWDKAYDADLSPTTPPDYRVFKATPTITEGDPKTGAQTVSYSGLVDETAAFEEGIAAVVAYVDANWESETWTTEYGLGVYFDQGGGGPMATVKMQRYRWKIPHMLTDQPFRGSYAKITWDIVRVPNPGSYATLEDNPDVSVVASDLTWVWDGPGDQNDPDDASWFSGWHDFNSLFTAPWDAGETTFAIVNARWEFYRGSKLGKKPMPFGTAYEPQPS